MLHPHGAHIAPRGPISEILDAYHKLPPTPLNVNKWVRWSARPPEEIEMGSFIYLARELPIRITQIMLYLYQLSPEVRESSNYHTIVENYHRTLLELQPFTEPVLGSVQPESARSSEVLELYRNSLRKIHRRHAGLVLQLSSASLEWKEKDPEAFDHHKSMLNHLLDRIFLVRIGVRVLISQHLALFLEPENYSRNDPTRAAGVFDSECQPSVIVNDAVEDARFLAMQIYGDAPQARIVGSSQSLATQFPYIPSHLHHIVFELSKNAIRATIENTHATQRDTTSYPPITIVLSKGDSDLTIKVSDVGGGICRTNISKIFDYSFTTASRPTDALEADISHAPLAGFGYGLPLSRQYARYLGGDVQVISMDGYGTDAYVYLKHVAADTIECVPVDRME